MNNQIKPNLKNIKKKQNISDIKDDVSSLTVSSRLTLLTIHFPSLRIIWSTGPDQTSYIFQQLKVRFTLFFFFFFFFYIHFRCPFLFSALLFFSFSFVFFFFFFSFLFFFFFIFIFLFFFFFFFFFV